MPPFEELNRSKPPVDLNVLKRNMTVAKGFLDISLLSANANQLRNIVNFGDTESSVYYLVLTGIILSLILQVTSGVVLIVAERFDINKEEDHDQSDLYNTVVVSLVFLVLIINVFVASLGVEVTNPHPHKSPYPAFHTTTTTTIPHKDVLGFQN